jgi:hypothetical protein
MSMATPQAFICVGYPKKSFNWEGQHILHNGKRTSRIPEMRQFDSGKGPCHCLVSMVMNSRQIK